MSKSKSIARIVLYLLLAMLIAIALTGCDDDNTETKDSGVTGVMKDPYEAYGLEKGDYFELLDAMREKPPAALLLQPAVYYRPYYESVPLSGEIVLEKGKSVNYSLDVDTVHTSGETVNIKSGITIKYDGKKGDDDLFHADTNTYGNPTLIIKGLYVTEFGYHNVKDKPVRIAGEEEARSHIGREGVFLYVVLHPDKSNADGGDGNIGFVYLRVAGVKR